MTKGIHVSEARKEAILEGLPGSSVMCGCLPTRKRTEYLRSGPLLSGDASGLPVLMQGSLEAVLCYRSIAALHRARMLSTSNGSSSTAPASAEKISSLSSGASPIPAT